MERLQQWATPPHIYVIDNASAVADVNQLSAAAQGFHLIRNAENLGFAGGNNRGIAAALDDGAGFILLLNNDAFIDEVNLHQLVEVLRQRPDIGSIGPLLFDAESPDHLLSAGGRSPLHHHTHMLPLQPGPRLRAVDYIPGTVILIRAEVFRAVGLLDETYFFSTEVADFCLRARAHGYRSVVDTQTRAEHTLSRSSEFRGTLYTYYIIRNRFIYIRKFHPRAWPLLAGFWGLYSGLLASKEALAGQRATARAMRLGLSDGLRGRFGGQNERVLALCAAGAARR